MMERLQKARNRIMPCDPPAWARTGHLQTIFGHFFSSPRISEQGEHINIPLENEEQLHSVYLKGESSSVLYLFHGLAGSIEAGYMQRTALIARELGYHVFLSNHRGCGEGLGLASEPYHSGRAEDLSKVIEFGRKMLPDHHHVALGFSLSANALLLLAAGERGDVLPDVAISVNAPINLDQSSLNLQRGLNRLYNFRFILDLRKHVRNNHPLTFPLIKDVWELREFDEAYTARVGGFRDRAHYYSTCSSGQYVSRLKIPTVILSAKDDPFISSEDYQGLTLPPHVLLHLEEHGGHMGYLIKSGRSYERWLDYALGEYLKCLVAR